MSLSAFVVTGAILIVALAFGGAFVAMQYDFYQALKRHDKRK